MRSFDFTSNGQETEALRAELNFLSRILDQTESLIIILDKQRQAVRFNRACERLFGYTSDQIYSLFVTGALPLPKEIGAIKTILSQLRSGRNMEQYENQWTTSSGDVRTLLWSISVLTDQNQELEFILATGTDITSRKEAEKLLERERMLLQSLINSIPDVIFYKDQKTAYMGCNAAFESYHGHKAEEVTGKTDADLYPYELYDRFLSTDLKVLENGEVASYELWTTDPQGEQVLLETRKTPLYGPNREIQGIIGIGRDITKHRLVENDLRQAKSEIEQLISSLSSVLIALSLELRITRWNPMAEKIFGLKAEDVTGINIIDLHIQWDKKKIVEGILKCYKKAEPVFLDPLRFKRVDGSEGSLGVNIGPLRNREGKVAGFILICGDITERKIFENRLTQAEKLQSIGQLAAGIAHEINTPIQYVGNNLVFLQESFNSLLEVIDRNKEPDNTCLAQRGKNILMEQAGEGANDLDIPFLIQEIPTAISQSLEGIKRVSEIVQAMREFSHPGIKEKTLLDINHALETTLAVAKNEWKYVATLETYFDQDLPKVLCIPGAVNQVFLNIVVNAAQAIASSIGQEENPKKGIIQITTRKDGNFVEVRVTDNGPGIPEEIRPKIFEPFFTTKEVGKGTGQGLAIAYDVITSRHQGQIYFETEVGIGTTFVIRLPIR